MEQILIRPIGLIFSLVQFAILGRVLLSWIKPDQSHPAIKLLYEVTEPILQPIRNLTSGMGGGMGMLDFSPIIALLLLNVLEGLIKYIIAGLF
jgi:YggT family protein